MASTLRAVFSYENTSSTRQYDFEIEDQFISGAKQKVLDINSSLEAGTAGGLSSFFVSDDGDNFKKISALKLISKIETPVILEGSD